MADFPDVVIRKREWIGKLQSLKAKPLLQAVYLCGQGAPRSHDTDMVLHGASVLSPMSAINVIASTDEIGPWQWIGRQALSLPKGSPRRLATRGHP